MAELPFVFGKFVSGMEFTDRKAETQRLMTNFSSLVNTVLISPRRWGKSSLVQKAAKEVHKKDKTIRVVFLDMYNVRTEAEFYEILATEVLKATATKWEDMLANIREFFSQFIPKVSFSPDPNSEISLALDWEQVKEKPSEILNLAEVIGKAKNLQIIVCIDEFQNIPSFEDPLGFQKKLRSHWQKHQHVGYCLYGSKRHMLIEVFASPSMPFYKFGDLIFLEKIKEKDWVTFIRKRFRDTGKEISKEGAAHIARYADCHPYYVQQLAQQSWLRCDIVCEQKDIDAALESLLMQLSLLFQKITDELSNTQVKFLQAMLSGVTQFSAQMNLSKYQLGSSANVIRIKSALINKEIIDAFSDKLTFVDPMYMHWLKRFYFKL